MAERRMFAKTIVLSDAFLDMPMGARCLYFTLGMFADDDGFVNSPKSIMRQIGAAEDDLNVLVARKFILPFESGIIVIKHWRINNYLRSDRYNATKYIDEKNELVVEENGSYTKVENLGIPNIGIPNIGIPSIGKDSIVKESISIMSGKPDHLSEKAAKIIARLNEKTGANYLSTTKSTRQHIHARLEEGFTVEDFYTVIDAKAAEWMGDPKMEPYLRPDTLFCTKFEGYLQAAKRASTGGGVWAREQQDDLDFVK